MSRPTITTHPVGTTGSGHLHEFLYDDGANDRRLLCAGHGGEVEPGTAEAAIELAAALPETTCWATLGYEDGGSAFDQWHPPSTAFDAEEYPLLGEIADREFATVVSLHGLADDEVLVGGGTDDAAKRALASRLDDALAVPARPVFEGEYAGVHPENFVNWLAADGGGLQLELGPTPRSDDADAVREVLERFLRENPA